MNNYQHELETAKDRITLLERITTEQEVTIAEQKRQLRTLNIRLFVAVQARTKAEEKFQELISELKRMATRMHNRIVNREETHGD